MPPSARIGDMHMCLMATPGLPTVLIGYMPAARMGDMTTHGGKIVIGCPTVMIG